MEAMPQSWNDDRLDDLNVKVDRGFEHVDKRFEAVDKRLERLDERIHEDSVAVRVEIRESAENTQRMLIQAMLAILTLTMGGFSGLIVLIATRL
jgi:hypothetical protein